MSQEAPKSDPERTIRIANALVTISENCHLEGLAFNLLVNADMAQKTGHPDYLRAAEFYEKKYEKEIDRLIGSEDQE
jgi:hypothetical protein